MRHFITNLCALAGALGLHAQTMYVCSGGSYDIHHAQSAKTLSYVQRTGNITIGTMRYKATDIDSIVFTRPADLSLNTKRWMASLPNATPLRRLTIPGAHDAATKACSDVGKCQSLTISELLNSGVRALDLRPRYTANRESDIALNNLEIYHGYLATGVLFKDAIADIVAFLRENTTETVVINLLKESSGGTDYSSTWRTAIRTCLQNNSQYVLTQLTASTALTSCRGKMVVISHNPYGSEGVYNDIVYGALTSSWGDDASFTTDLLYTWGTRNATAHVTDNYNATSSSTKQSYVRSNLDAASSSDDDYYISFMNVAWSLFGSTPKTYAKTHNAWLSGLLRDNTWSGRLGIVFCDFCADNDATPDLMEQLILQNHRSLWP